MDALEDVLAWVDRDVPGGREALGLRGPADERALAAYERELGVPLPADVRALWLQHDGQSQDDTGWLPARWLSVDESRAMRSELLQFVVPEWLERTREDDPRLRDLVYHPLRIPWASSSLQDLYCAIDLAPGPEGRRGQLLVNTSECDFAVLGRDVTAFFERYAALARDGRLTFDVETLAFGVSAWHVLAIPPAPAPTTDGGEPFDGPLTVDRWGSIEARPVWQWLHLLIEGMVSGPAIAASLRELPHDTRARILAEPRATILRELL
jgi:cell wall assembly regulator SMI1